MARCFCTCHEYPGTYPGPWCGYCQHDNRRGQFPGTLREGWQPDESPEAVLERIVTLVERWDNSMEASAETLELIQCCLRAKWRKVSRY